MLSQVITLPSFPLTAEVKLDIKHTRASEFCLWEERGWETGLALRYLVGKCGRGRKEIAEFHEGGRLPMRSLCVMVPMALEQRRYCRDNLGAAVV